MTLATLNQEDPHLLFSITDSVIILFAGTDLVLCSICLHSIHLDCS